MIRSSSALTVRELERARLHDERLPDATLPRRDSGSASSFDEPPPIAPTTTRYLHVPRSATALLLVVALVIAFDLSLSIGTAILVSEAPQLPLDHVRLPATELPSAVARAEEPLDEVVVDQRPPPLSAMARRRLRICVVSDSPRPRAGSPSEDSHHALHELSRLAASLGHEVRVALVGTTGSTPPAGAPEDAAVNITYERVTSLGAAARGTALAALHAYAVSQWLLLQHPQCDVAHFVDVASHAAYAIILQSQGLGLASTALALHVHAPLHWKVRRDTAPMDDPEMSAALHLEKVAVGLAPHVLVTSGYMRTWLRHAGLTPRLGALQLAPFVLPHLPAAAAAAAGGASSRGKRARGGSSSDGAATAVPAWARIVSTCAPPSVAERNVSRVIERPSARRLVVAVDWGSPTEVRFVCNALTLLQRYAVSSGVAKVLVTARLGSPSPHPPPDRFNGRLAMAKLAQQHKWKFRYAFEEDWWGEFVAPPRHVRRASPPVTLLLLPLLSSSTPIDVAVAAACRVPMLSLSMGGAGAHLTKADRGAALEAPDAHAVAERLSEMLFSSRVAWPTPRSSVSSADAVAWWARWHDARASGLRPARDVATAFEGSGGGAGSSPACAATAKGATIALVVAECSWRSGEVETWGEVLMQTVRAAGASRDKGWVERTFAMRAPLNSTCRRATNGVERRRLVDKVRHMGWRVATPAAGSEVCGGDDAGADTLLSGVAAALSSTAAEWVLVVSIGQRLEAAAFCVLSHLVQADADSQPAATVYSPAARVDAQLLQLPLGDALSTGALRNTFGTYGLARVSTWRLLSTMRGTVQGALPLIDGGAATATRCEDAFWLLFARASVAGVLVQPVPLVLAQVAAEQGGVGEAEGLANGTLSRWGCAPQRQSDMASCARVPLLREALMARLARTNNASWAASAFDVSALVRAAQGLVSSSTMRRPW